MCTVVAPYTASSFVANDEPIEYELRAAHELPTIDCSLSVKHALFHDRWLSRYNTFQHASKRLARIGFAIGVSFACAFPFLDRRVGQWLAVAGASLMAVQVVSSYLMLRLDLMKLLVTTYEFWYLAFVSMSAHVMVCWCLRDARISLIICLVLMYQYVLLIDANSRGAWITVLASGVGAIFIFLFVVVQGFHLMRDYDEWNLVEYQSWSVSVSDIVTNGISTILLVILRNAYRKHTVVRSRHDGATVRCITYRARLQYHPIGRLPTPILCSQVQEPGAKRVSQLRLVPSIPRIRSDEFLQSFCTLCKPTSRNVARIWTVVGVSGLSLTWLSLLFTTTPFALPLAAMASSLSYCGRCFLFQNRAVLRRMLTSFDWLFLSTQSYLAHFALCYLFHWDAHKCMPVVTALLWTHWVFTMDALTPIVRQRLGVSPRLAYLVLVLKIVAHTTLSVDLVYRCKWVKEDRRLFDLSLFGRRNVGVYAAPFLLNRMVTTLLWCMRLLWRLHRRVPNELFMVHGAVEYDDFDAPRHPLPATKTASSPHEDTQCN